MKLCTLRILCCLLPLTYSGVVAVEEQSAQKATDSDKSLSEFFAGRLMLMNHSAIQMSSLATRESSSEEIREFARKLHEGHAKLNRQLSETAPDIVAITSLDSAGKPKGKDDQPTVPGERKEEIGQRDNKTVEGRAPKTMNSGKLLHQVLHVDRQATDNYIQSSVEMLSKYEGQDFDMGFLGFQIGAHTWSLA